MSGRYRYVKGLADSAQERAAKAHKKAMEARPICSATCGCNFDLNYYCGYHGRLYDFFYWIGHANAYRGIALQVDFMETVEENEDSEFTCP